MNESNSLSDLLNDESFLRWIRGNATVSEKKEWDRWLSENPDHQVKVEKAQKIVSMPFKNAPMLPDKVEEVRKLKESLFRKKKLQVVKSKG